MSRPIVRPPQAPTYSVELAVESPSLGVIVVAEIQGFSSFNRAKEFALRTTSRLLEFALATVRPGLTVIVHGQFAYDAGVDTATGIVVAQNVTEYLPGTVTTIEINPEQEA